MLGGTARDTGSASSVGLIIAAATFMGAFVFAQAMVAEPGGMDPRPLALEQQAAPALDVLVHQSGRGSTPNWATSPDGMQRFGLAKEGEPNFLDYLKIKALRNGSMVASPTNNAPDYPEARAAIGMTTGNFHLRSYPVLPSFEDPRWTKDPRGRLAYVGHFDSPRGYATMGAWANTTDRLNVSLAIRNDGMTPHIFVATVGIGNQASGAVIATQQRHTILLQPGEVQTVWANFPRMSYSPAVTGVKLDLVDSYGTTIVAPYWIAATAPSSGSTQQWAPHLAAAEQYFHSPDEVVFIADHFEGDGTRMNQDQAAIFVLVGPDGTVIDNKTVSLPKNKVYRYECEDACEAPGTYVATLWNTGLTHRARDVVHVSATKLFTESETMSATAQKEIQLIQELVSGFNGNAYINGSYPGGDVFSDSSHVRDLPDVLDRYTMLVVGSEVKQNALNAAGTKWGIADWVQGGGNLVVLGTTEGASNWLEPVYKAAQSNANGGISAPDPTHAVLSTPERLDYQRYLDNARAWRIQDDQPFTNVLERAGAPPGTHDSTLAIANPGAYNDGTVVLTSYVPSALTSPQDDREAKRLLHNLFSQSYNMLFLDYGPPVPDGAPVGAAQRLAAVPHPNVPGAVVEVRLVMYLFD